MNKLENRVAKLEQAAGVSTTEPFIIVIDFVTPKDQPQQEVYGYESRSSKPFDWQIMRTPNETAADFQDRAVKEAKRALSRLPGRNVMTLLQMRKD